MKKYLNEIVFINSGSLKNKRNKSPYVFIYNIEKQDNDFYKIYCIDRLGNKDFINVSYDWIKRTIEIFEPLEYMKKEFIEVMFKL